MIKTMFLIPIRDNAGHEFGATDWAELEHRLLQFGGASAGGLVSGSWEAGGGVFHDTSRQYQVGLARWTDLPAWLDLIRWVRRRFRQNTIYIEVAGIPEIIER